MKFDVMAFARNTLFVSAAFAASAQATPINDIEMAFKVVPKCYEPEDMTPDRIKELKDIGAEMCEARCFDENFHFESLVESRKARGAKICRYEHS